jgi:hypothetical protein
MGWVGKGTAKEPVFHHGLSSFALLFPFHGFADPVQFGPFVNF